jgi:hypothetical protein
MLMIIATVLLPTLAIVQRSQQLPQPRQPGQWCLVGWMASGNYCVPGSEKAPAAIPKNGWCRPAGARAAVTASAEGPPARDGMALHEVALNRSHREALTMWLV